MIDIDFHAHILPGCDHGSDGIHTSLCQLSLAKEAGVGVICATSHFYGHETSVDRFLKRRAQCFEQLIDAAPVDSPQILLGAEVLAFEGMERLEGIKELRLEGTRYLLLEMPFSHWSDRLLDSVEALSENESFRIILAHVDRYDRKDVEQLFGLNHVRGQVNVSAMRKRLGAHYLRKWTDQGRIVALGSDIHGTHTGYAEWLSCQKRYPETWAAIMRRTNIRLKSVVAQGKGL